MATRVATSRRRSYYRFLLRHHRLTCPDVATLLGVSEWCARTWSSGLRGCSATQLRRLLLALDAAGYPPLPPPPPGVLDD